MLSTNSKHTIFILLLAISFFAYLRYIERRSIYFPMKEIATTPAVINMAFEDIYFKTDDGIMINAWFLPSGNAKEAVLFCHGNGGNISHRVEKIAILHNLGLSVFIFDYRGYGKSRGRPSEKGLYKDANAAYRYLLKEKGLSQENIILYGESLGAAVAIDLAGRQKVKALIIEGAFSSVRDMSEIIYPFLPSFILGSRFESAAKIKEVGVPKLIIHSADDEIIPFRLSRKIFINAPPPKEFLKLRGSHNTAFLDSEEEYLSGLKEFLSEVSNGRIKSDGK